MALSFFLVVALLLVGVEARLYHKCPKDDVEFATKVNSSPVVVLGEVTSKKMTGETNFKVDFRVACVLKGAATLETITINNAGYSSDKHYCQDLPVTPDFVIVFLHPSTPDDHKTFTPADFQEIEADSGNFTEDLLARTCSLQRILPLQSKGPLETVCPFQVSLPAHCPQGVDTRSLKSRETIEGNAVSHLVNSTFYNITTTAFPSTIGMLSTVLYNAVSGKPLDAGHQTHPISSAQEEVKNIQGKTGATGHGDAKNGGAAVSQSSALVLLGVSALLLFVIAH